MGDPQLTVGFNTNSWSDLEDLGVPPILRNLVNMTIDCCACGGLCGPEGSCGRTLLLDLRYVLFPYYS